MATVTGLTADRMIEIEDASVVSGAVIDDHLILTTHGGDTIDAGDVRGPAGPSGEGGASENRATLLFTTSSLADGASEEKSEATRGMVVFKVVTDVPARVRAYPSDAYRDADRARPIGTDPDQETDHGVLMEVITATGMLTVITSPAPAIFASTSTLYFEITNLNGSASVVNVTLHYLRLEV